MDEKKRGKAKKPKKEKKPKAPKPKKEKKPKPPKPKKEKKPKAPKPKKEKKPKAPKPKKEKRPKRGKKAAKPAKAAEPEPEEAPAEETAGEGTEPAAEGEDAGEAAAAEAAAEAESETEDEDEDEEEERGGLFANKKLLILLIGVVVLIGVAAFLALRVFKLFPGTADPEPEETEAVETEAPEETPEPEETEGPEAPAATVELLYPIATAEPGSESGAEPGEETEATPAPVPTRPLEIRTQITNAQVLEFVRSLSPAALGLEGEDMSDYEMFSADNVSIVDGLYCTQVRVYSKNPSAGTNDIEGIYFVSRGEARRLFRYDEETDTVTEIPL